MYILSGLIDTAVLDWVKLRPTSKYRQKQEILKTSSTQPPIQTSLTRSPKTVKFTTGAQTTLNNLDKTKKKTTTHQPFWSQNKWTYGMFIRQVSVDNTLFSQPVMKKTMNQMPSRHFINCKQPQTINKIFLLKSESNKDFILYFRGEEIFKIFNFFFNFILLTNNNNQ